MGPGRGGQRRRPPRPGRLAKEQLMASVIKTGGPGGPAR
jgi:hypothetical protein